MGPVEFDLTDDFLRQFHELQQRCAAVDPEELLAARTRIAELEAQVAAQSAEIGDLKRMAADRDAEHREELAALRQELATLQATGREQERTRAEGRRQTELMIELGRITVELERLREENRRLTETLSASPVKAEIRRLTERIHLLEQQLAASRERSAKPS